MYGTVAKMRLKPGAEAKMMELTKGYESLGVPGYVGIMVYRMDSGSNEYYMTVAFRDKESYVANANSPAQDARYREMVALLDGEPEWHDGEVVYAFNGAGR